jgi:hypothetical protein
VPRDPESKRPQPVLERQTICIFALSRPTMNKHLTVLHAALHCKKNNFCTTNFSLNAAVTKRDME